MNTSAPTSASCKDPVRPAGFVASASDRLAGASRGSDGARMPSRSHTRIDVTPAASSSVTIAVPAAPPPATTTRADASGLPTQRSALVSAARTTIAVPCWSSWNTGMSSRSRRRRSISKHRGAEMSSRLMPPKPGAIARTTATISSVSWVSRQIGHASMPRETLEQRRLALHHRQRRARADVAEPEHRRAVGDDGDAVALHGQAGHVRRVGGDRQGHPPDARRVRHRQVVAGAQRHLGLDGDLAAEVQQERPVADPVDRDARRAPTAPRRSPGRASRRRPNTSGRW